MRVEDLEKYIFERVSIYVDEDNPEQPYKDVYVGVIGNATEDVKRMIVISIGTSKGILDIHVK